MSSSRRSTATCALPTSSSTDSATISTRCVNIEDFVAMQAVRPLSLSLSLDAVLSQRSSRSRRSCEGRWLRREPGWRIVAADGRRAADDAARPGLQAGHVRSAAQGRGRLRPVFRAVSFPAFGRDQKGLHGITLPYLAISGTADTTAPIAATRKGLRLPDQHPPTGRADRCRARIRSGRSPTRFSRGRWRFSPASCPATRWRARPARA